MRNLLAISSLVLVTLAFCLSQAAMDEKMFYKKTTEIIQESERYLKLKNQKDQIALLKSIFAKVRSLQSENPNYEGLGRLNQIKEKNPKLFEQELQQQDKQFQDYVEDAIDVKESERIDEKLPEAKKKPHQKKSDAPKVDSEKGDD